MYSEKKYLGLKVVISGPYYDLKYLKWNKLSRNIIL